MLTDEDAPKDTDPDTEPFWVHLDGPNGETEKVYVQAWDHIDAKELGEHYISEVRDRDGWTVSDVRAA